MKPGTQRKKYYVETFLNTGELSSARIRVRPLPGQGVSIKTRVECSRQMRRTHPVGTVFRISARFTDREGGKPFLITPYTAEYEVVPRELALDELKNSKHTI